MADKTTAEDSSFSEHSFSTVTTPQFSTGTDNDGTSPKKKKKKKKKARKKDEEDDNLRDLTQDSSPHTNLTQFSCNSDSDGLSHAKKKKKNKKKKEDEEGDNLRDLTQDSSPHTNLTQFSYNSDSDGLGHAKKKKKNKKKKENHKRHTLDNSKLEEEAVVESDESLEISFKSDYSCRKKMNEDIPNHNTSKADDIHSQELTTQECEQPSDTSFNRENSPELNKRKHEARDKSWTQESTESRSFTMKEYDWPSDSSSSMDISPMKRKKPFKVLDSVVSDDSDVQPNETQELENEVTPRKKLRLDEGSSQSHMSAPDKTHLETPQRKPSKQNAPRKTPSKSQDNFKKKKKKKKDIKPNSSDNDIISDDENAGEDDPFNTKVSYEKSRSAEKSKKKNIQMKQEHNSDNDIVSDEESESDSADEEMMAECISKIEAYGDRLGSTKTDILVSDEVSKIIHPVNSIRGDLGPTLLKELIKKGYEMRTCRYTCMEDFILKRNWKEFCDEHPIDNPLLLLDIPHDEELKRLVTKCDFFISLARNLNRSVRSCFQRAQVLLCNPKSKNENQIEDWEKVEELFKKHGKKWKLISKATGMNYEAIRSVYRLKKRAYSTGAWTSNEEEALLKAVEEAKSDLNISDDLPDENLPWSQIASKVTTRGEYQCRRHWYFAARWKNSLEEKDNEKWTFSDSVLLFQLVRDSDAEEENQVPWKDFMSDFPSAPSPLFLREKWCVIKRKIDKYKSHSFKNLLKLLQNNLERSATKSRKK